MTIYEKMGFKLLKAHLDQLGRIGQECLNFSLLAAAEKFGVTIIANPINQASLPRLVQDQTQSKQMHICSRTQKEGVAAGLILAEKNELNAKPLIETIDDQLFYAVERSGKTLFVETLLPNDTQIHVSCYPCGSVITSDLDLIAITYKEDTDFSFCPKEDPFGELTTHDKTVIFYINHVFKRSVDEKFGQKGKTQLNLISHGPSCHFSKSKQSHLHFPMQIFSPNGTLSLLGCEEDRKGSLQEFIDLKNLLSTQKQILPLNPKWNLLKENKHVVTSI